MSKIIRFTEFEEIFDYRITHENSAHSILYLKTRVSKNHFYNIDSLIGKVIKADIYDEAYDEESTKHVKNIFLGIIDNVEVNFENNAFCEVYAHSFSKLLDSDCKNRIFQNETKSLLDILKTVCDYEGIVLKGDGVEHISVPSPIVQYNETDWHFMLRICKQLGCKVSLSHDFYSEKEGTIWIGEIGRKPIEIQKNQIISKKYKDNVCYICFRDENIYEVGDIVSLENVNYSISTCCFYMKNQALIREYKISTCVEKEIEKMNLEGIVIPAEVVSLEGDGKCRGQIQVKFDWEESVSQNRIWIDWLTPYCDDSIGIYNMPAIGEKVLVTLLDTNGTSMIAHSCIRKSEIDQDINVTDKIIKVGDKEIQIKGNMILVKNKNSMITIESENIRIETKNGNWKLANGKSTIETDGENIIIDSAQVEIKSNKLKITGNQEVSISGKKTTIESPSIELKGMVEVK